MPVQTTEPGATGTTPPATGTPATPPAAGTPGAAAHAGGEPQEVDESKWDDKTKAYITKIRKEAATRRTENKTLEEKVTALGEQFGAVKKALGIEKDETPEQKIEVLQNSLYASQHESQLYKIALEKGIVHDDVEYFSYLVSKAASSLKENEEMSAETLDGIVADVKKRSAKPGATSTSVSTAGAASGEGAPGANNPTDITVEQFAKMNTSQKSEIYVKNRALYDNLMQQAKAKRVLI